MGQLLFFSDSNNNNKLSVTSSSLSANYIQDENIHDIYDYSVESMTSIDNIIYFTNTSDNNSLYKLDYERKSNTFPMFLQIPEYRPAQVLHSYQPPSLLHSH